MRNVLERASARETAARVAGGALAKAFLRALGRRGPLARGADRLGRRRPARDAPLRVEDFEGVDDDPVRCLDPRREPRDGRSTSTSSARRTSRSAASSRSSPSALTPGLGSHTSWESRLDGRLTGALCSIQAVKGATIGDAFDVAGRPGSEAHDEIFFAEERGFYRETNHAGGLEGGMTTGEPRRRARRR